MYKLFIIAPHFPPSALPPSQRVRLLVSHLYEFDWYPTVFTVKHKYREEIEDPWMLKLVGNEYELIEVDCQDQKTTRKFGLGDLGLRMLPYLFWSLIKTAKKEHPDFILYPVPPWYILLIAPIIKWITKVPYGIDFIDPWVHEQGKTYANFKYKISQWIAKSMEGWVCRHASVIFSVSVGINENLKSRHPSLENIPMVAVPYGAEENDFILIDDKIDVPNNEIMLRYIGALWNDCYPVLDGLMPSLSNLHDKVKIKIEFYGTSYAGEGLSKPHLNNWIFENKMESYVIERPLRVDYKEAVMLTMTADVLFLIGGMQPYYAASKLMGLVVSQKPFLAFVHKDSFPAQFLKELDYPYVVTYSSVVGDLPVDKISELTDTFIQLLNSRDQFVPIPLTHPLVTQYSAKGMTNSFVENISLAINN